MSRSREIFPTAPTHARIGKTEEQVQAAAQLAANYYRASSWRSQYEWEQADQQEIDDIRSGRRKAPSDQEAPVQYSWQQLQTAQDYIKEAAAQNKKVGLIRQGITTFDDDNNSTSTRFNATNNATEAFQSIPAFQPAATENGFNQTTDQPQSHEHLHASQHTPQQQKHSQSMAANSQAYYSPREQSKHFFIAGGLPPATLAGIPIKLRELPGEIPAPPTYVSPKKTARTLRITQQQQQPQQQRPVPAGPTEPLSPRFVQAMPLTKVDALHGGLAGAGKKRDSEVTYHCRGAGALPTHRHTTRTRLLSALNETHHPHVKAHAHVVNMDWSDWARNVEKKLAQSRGTLQVRGNGSVSAR